MIAEEEEEEEAGMSGRLTTIQREVMSQIRLSWAFGLALYFSFYLLLSCSSLYLLLLLRKVHRRIASGWEWVCIEQGSGRLDALFYFFHLFFRACLFFLPMNERTGCVK